MATLLIKNADVVLTMDAARREIRDGALYVRDNVIENIGTTDELPKTADRVTVAGSKEMNATIASARQAAGGARAARLERLEAQVRSGGFRPDPSRLAQQILSDAELEAKIQSMLNR